jgi:DNA-directed RNA polymerase specialized sigma24 family protein
MKDDETTYFRHCRDITGKLEPVGVTRRNGKSVPSFSPHLTEPDRRSRGGELRELLRELMYGLNRKERRTWLLLLLGLSIIDIAQREGVSRSAIYERIRGNSKGQGGMIRKNDYVYIWWRDQRNKS